MEEMNNEFGERVIRVENADEFWQVYEKGEGEFLIDAPAGVAESLGFDDPEPEDA